jgi:hypothetical protein
MESKKNTGSDVTCRETFAAAVDLFLQLAKEQAQDGKLSLDGLDLIAQAIQNDPDIRHKYCQAHFERCSANMRKSIKNVPRVNIFGRIISQPFEHLLKQDQPVLATAQLSNYFHAIEHILGRANYERFMERSLRLMERLTTQEGSRFTYQHLYQDEECWEIRWDCIIALATFFTNFDVRKEWFKRVMQSDPDTPGTGIGSYLYSDFHFKSQMMCIFTDFTNLSEEEQGKFEKRFTKKERKAFSSFLANVASIEEEA